MLKNKHVLTFTTKNGLFPDYSVKQYSSRDPYERIRSGKNCRQTDFWCETVIYALLGSGFEG